MKWSAWWSFEDAAEVASNHRLRFNRAILVAGVALIAFHVIFLLVTGVFRTFFRLQVRQLIFQTFNSVEQHLVNLLLFLQLAILLVNEVLHLLQPALERIVDPLLFTQRLPGLLVLLLEGLGVVEGVRLWTLDIGSTFGVAVRMTVVVHLLIIITFKIK
jgi:hypothetical protein